MVKTWHFHGRGLGGGGGWWGSILDPGTKTPQASRVARPRKKKGPFLKCNGGWRRFSFNDFGIENISLPSMELI